LKVIQYWSFEGYFFTLFLLLIGFKKGTRSASIEGADF
jgi:hypothetical protein